MKTFLIIARIFLALQFTATAQDWKQKLKITFLKADSVKLVSHKTTSGIRITKKDRDEQDLVRQGRVNNGIISMQALLDHQTVERIVENFTRKNSDTEVEMIKAFTPHHGIVIYNKNFISWMDIDFGARQINTSPDIKIGDNLSKSSWENLEQLFRSRRFDF